MKKMISLCLAAVMMTSGSVMAFEKPQDDVTFFVEGEDRLFRTGKAKAISDDSSAVLEAHPTENVEIFQVTGEEFLVHLYGDIYQRKKKLDVNVDRYQLGTDIAREYDLPIEVAEQISEVVREQTQHGNDSLEVAVFEPSVSFLSGNTTAGDPYQYKGYTMQDYITEYRHMTAALESDGEDCKDIASSLVDLVISGTGIVSQKISIFGAGLSALDFYEKLHGPVKKGMQTDRFYSNVSYDKLVKNTYVYNTAAGGYEKGCQTEKVWLEQQDTYQYYALNGAREYKENRLNITKYTENFKNAPEAAIKFFGPGRDDFPVELIIGHTTFEL